MSNKSPRWLTGFAALVYLVLFTPIVVLIIFSFNDSRAAFIWGGFTFDWYPKLFGNDDIVDALGVTLQVAAIAVFGSTILGSLLGLGLARLRFRGAGAVQTLLLLPMITPEIIVGISLLVFFFQLVGSTGSIAQISLAHITFCISYVAITVRARAANLNPQLEEAARDLGASAWQTFAQVVLPILLPGIIAVALFGFTLSYDEFARTLLTVGPNNTLPLEIWAMTTNITSPALYALGTLTTVVSFVVITAALTALAVIQRRRAQRRPHAAAAR